jgi:hypothetical protein
MIDLSLLANRASREGLRGNLIIGVILPTSASQSPEPTLITKPAEWESATQSEPI